MAAKMPSGGSQGWMPKKNTDKNPGMPKDDKFNVVGPGHEQQDKPRNPGKQTHKTKSDS